MYLINCLSVYIPISRMLTGQGLMMQSSHTSIRQWPLPAMRTSELFIVATTPLSAGDDKQMGIGIIILLARSVQ